MKSGMTALYAILLFCLSSIYSVESAERYVDSGAGVSTEDGTSENPCLSISKCMYDVAHSGDTVKILPGIYTGIYNEGVCSLPAGQTKKNCTAINLSLVGVGDPKDILWYNTALYAQRAIVIDSDVVKSMSNMTISGFHYHPFSNEPTDFRYAGGAVEIKNTTLTLENMIFTNNSAAQVCESY